MVSIYLHFLSPSPIRLVGETQRMQRGLRGFKFLILRVHFPAVLIWDRRIGGGILGSTILGLAWPLR